MFVDLSHSRPAARTGSNSHPNSHPSIGRKVVYKRRFSTKLQMCLQSCFHTWIQKVFGMSSEREPSTPELSLGLTVCLPPNCLCIPHYLTRGLISCEDLWGSKPRHLQPLTHKHTTPLNCTKPPLCNTMVATPFAFPLYPLVWFTHNSAPFSLWPVSLVVFVSQCFILFYFSTILLCLYWPHCCYISSDINSQSASILRPTVSKWTPNMCTTPNFQDKKVLKLRQKKKLHIMIRMIKWYIKK